MKALLTFAVIVLSLGAFAGTQSVRGETWEEFRQSKAAGEQGTGLVAKKSRIIPKGVILERLKKDREVVFESDSIHFAFGSSVVRESSASQLAEIAAALIESEDFRALPYVYVDGHCCNIGSDENNCRLSYERARAVIEALTLSADMPRSKFAARGFGERRPAFSNDTEEERSRNRRVVLRSPQAPAAADESLTCFDGRSDVRAPVSENTADPSPDFGSTDRAPKSPGFLPSKQTKGSRMLPGEPEAGTSARGKSAGGVTGPPSPQQDPNLPPGFIKSKGR